MELSAPLIIQDKNTNHVEINEEDVPHSLVLGTEDINIEPNLNDFESKRSPELTSVIKIDQSEPEDKIKSDEDANGNSANQYSALSCSSTDTPIASSRDSTVADTVVSSAKSVNLAVGSNIDTNALLHKATYREKLNVKTKLSHALRV